MRRIAIPVTKGQVANHLGHCQRFLVANVDDDGTVQQQNEVKNPGHGPGGPPPAFLGQLGVTEVVAFGMGAHARDWLSQLGIKVTMGAAGTPEDVLSGYLAGTLTLATEGLDSDCCSGGHHHDHGHDDDRTHGHGHHHDLHGGDNR